MIACAVLGMLVERFAYRPVRNAPKLTPLVTAIGVSMLIQNVSMLVFTSTPRGFPPVIRSSTVSLGPVAVTNIKLMNLGAALALMVALTFLVQRTRVGRAMRAISTNLDAARLMGVHTDRVIAITFGLGSALAGAGGILFGLDQPKIDPLSGVQPGLKAFVAAVLGVAIGALWARQRAAARELALTAENAKLAAQLETERAAAADKLATLEQNRERLTETFKALSSDALSRNAQQFLTLASTQLERFQLEAKQDLESRQKQIGETLNPIRESMQKVDEKEYFVGRKFQNI
jgi:uncharacterized membrane-anchored protein YhcB (DUF1043 family)